MGRRRWVREGIAAWADLILPRACAGCGVTGVALCPGCLALLSVGTAPETQDGPVTWAASWYEGPVARAVLAWKAGRPDLGVPFGAAVRALAGEVALALPRGAPVLVVPAPCGWRRRWSGRDGVPDLAAALVVGLEEHGHPAARARLLRRRGGRAHLLTARARRVERRASIRAGVRARAVLGANPDAVVVLVDDVTTTGATLAAAAERLGRAGGDVRAAVVLARTPAPGHRGR